MILTNKLNGIRYLEISGNINQNRILIFLPGLGAFKEHYIEHLKSFSSLYKTLYSMDLPEQGSKGNWSVGNMVDNLKEFIRQKDSSEITSIHIAGHSIGALASVSFLFNLDSKAENQLLKFKKNSQSKEEFIAVLKRLANEIEASECYKVDTVFLYAPPDNLNIVLPKRVSRFLNRQSPKFLKIMLDVTVNRTMILLSYFRSNDYFRFEIDKSVNPQYYKLVLKDYRVFLDYILNYSTIFEIQNIFQDTFRKRTESIMKARRILIQYGGNDWLIKPFFKRKKGINNILKFDPRIKLIRHSGLGHLMSNRLNLDVNLNRQMVTNNEVTKESIKFLED